MLRRLITVAIAATACAAFHSPLRAQSAADSAAIRATALDYVEGWYSGDAARMERALHPELAKRIMRRNGDQAVLQNMSAAQLVEATRRGGGRNTPAEQQVKEVRILDIFGNTASVRGTMAGWIDYMHLAKTAEGRWVIVNVLWEIK